MSRPPRDVVEYLTEVRAAAEAGLERVMRALEAPTLLAEAVRYALLGGGKRLRPCLTLATAECVGERMDLEPGLARQLALPAACAVEMVHSYSLVHDDLPAMDDDALRRGRPTTHVVYGDGLAVLVGDGLLTEAFGVVARSPSPAADAGAPEATCGQRLRAVTSLASAAGIVGMVGGQAIDLAAAGQVTDRPGEPFDGTALADMHARKTGALIRAAVTIGAVTAGADDDLIGGVDDYARELGLAFQIVDDVLDVEESAEALGKTAGKDAASGKPTYPALFGVDTSRRMAVECVDRAKAALSAVALRGRLADIADWSLTRRS